MYIHDATECAYKNGYKAGAKDFAKKLKEKYRFYGSFSKGELYKDVDDILKEIIGEDNERLTMPKEYHFEIGV